MLRDGHTTRDEMTLVIKNIRALVCDNFGEEYVDEQVAAEPARTADEAQRGRVQVDIRDYVAA